MTAHSLAVAEAAAVHRAAIAAALDAHERLCDAIRAYRAANPAPDGQAWHEANGAMRLVPVDDKCGHTYDDGTVCGDTATSWDADGCGTCEIHDGA